MQNLFLCLSLALVIIGCATSGKVTPKQAPQTKLNSFINYYVEVKSANPELKSLVGPLKLSVTQQIESLLSKKVSSRGPASKEGAVIELTIKDFENGNGFARFINAGGEAKIFVAGRIFDLSTKKMVHSFDLEGTSLHEGAATSVNGIPISKISRISDDTTKRALDSAGLYLAKYLAGDNQ